MRWMRKWLGETHLTAGVDLHLLKEESAAKRVRIVKSGKLHHDNGPSKNEGIGDALVQESEKCTLRSTGPGNGSTVHGRATKETSENKVNGPEWSLTIRVAKVSNDEEYNLIRKKTKVMPRTKQDREIQDEWILRGHLLSCARSSRHRSEVATSYLRDCDSTNQRGVVETGLHSRRTKRTANDIRISSWEENLGKILKKLFPAVKQ